MSSRNCGKVENQKSEATAMEGDNTCFSGLSLTTQRQHEHPNHFIVIVFASCQCQRRHRPDRFRRQRNCCPSSMPNVNINAGSGNSCVFDLHTQSTGTRVCTRGAQEDTLCHVDNPNSPFWQPCAYRETTTNHAMPFAKQHTNCKIPNQTHAGRKPIGNLEI